MNIDLNFTTLWTAVTGTVLAVVYMFTTFASASDVEELQLDILYGQFYDRLDDYEEELAEDDEQSAREVKRQMERIRARICELDPEWERCD